MFALLYTAMELLIKDKFSKLITWLNSGHCRAFSFVKIMVTVWARVRHVQVQIRISIVDVNIYRAFGLTVWTF